jgi:hypothetical protein
MLLQKNSPFFGDFFDDGDYKGGGQFFYLKF